VTFLVWDTDKKDEVTPYQVKGKYADMVITNIKELPFSNGTTQIGLFCNEDQSGEPKIILVDPVTKNFRDTLKIQNTDETGKFFEGAIEDVPQVYENGVCLLEIIQETKSRAVVYNYENSKTIASFDKSDSHLESFSVNGEYMVKSKVEFFEIDKEGAGCQQKVEFDLCFLIPKDLISFFLLLNAKDPATGASFFDYYGKDDKYVKSVFLDYLRPRKGDPLTMKSESAMKD
jgi:hypothetical protein